MAKQPKEPNVTRQKLDTTIKMVKLSSIIRPKNADFSFREDTEFTEEALKSLTEDIAESGLQTPLLLCDNGDETHTPIDCYRRLKALRILADRGVVGFSHDMLVPAHVLPKGTTELESVARAVSANCKRADWSAIGRAKAAKRLAQLGMPRKQIAQTFGVGDSTIDRDLAVTSASWLWAKIEEHAIKYSNAAALLEAATKADRVAELRVSLDEWTVETKKAIREENKRRKAKDEDLLKDKGLHPENWKTAQQKVATWKNALAQGLSMDTEEFRYRAGIKEEKGVKRFVADAANVPVSDLSEDGLAKIYCRARALVKDIPPLMKAARAASATRSGAAQSGSLSNTDDEAFEELRELGFADVVDRLEQADRDESEASGKEDADFDRPPERKEEDHLSEDEDNGHDEDRDEDESDESEWDND